MPANPMADGSAPTPVRPLFRSDVDYMNDFGLGIKGAVELHLLADETAWQFLVVEMIDVPFGRQHEFPSQVLDAILRA